jgi:transcriptional regulator with XRE-family HTH domain
MHVQMNARPVRHGTDRTDVAEVFEVATVQGLGQYLRTLRESRHVTQAGLSTKAGAMAGCAISRSRISEIENARRDRVSERELRMYMAGLKCAPHHVDQMVKALRQCAVIPQSKQASASSAPSKSYPVESRNVEIVPRTHKEDAKDNPTMADQDCREQADAPACPFNASQFQPTRHCQQYHRITLFTAIVLIIVTLTGLAVGLCIQRQRTNISRPPAILALWLTSPKTPLTFNGNNDGKNMIRVSHPSLVPADKELAKPKSPGSLDPRGAVNPDPLRHTTRLRRVYRIKDKQVVFLAPIIDQDWRSYALTKDEWWSDFGDGRSPNN